MSVRMKRIRLFAEFLMIWSKICHTVSDQTICSEYLVSGLYGIDDSAITASSVWSTPDHKPQNARLHFNGNLGGIASAWCAGKNDNQPYIQVRFPREIAVDAVMLQGRGDVSYQFVKTYYLLYSMDGIMWVNVTSPNQQPRLFIGNNDTNTMVKSSLVPSITTVYLRINPRSYNHHISLRFDVSGCYIVKETKGRSEFYRVPLLPSQDYTQHVLFETLSSSLPECGQQCHKDKECGFFSFDMNQGNCRGFVSTPTTYSAFSTGLTPSFVKRGLFTSLGYRQIKNESLIYRVNEVSLNQTSASNVCIQQHSQLLKIAFESEMLSLQTIVAGNTILDQYHFHLFVSGMYVSNQCQYSDGEVMNSALWSPGNPDLGEGHCVVLARNGLTSANCSERLFSVCELL